MSQQVNIIGAGIAGLAAGCYLQMNGYRTRIFELHSHPGGLCTAWQRQGYTIDNCLHWLIGSRPGSSFNRLWNELIDMRQLEFVDPEVYFTIEDRLGDRLTLFVDPDRLEAELLRQSPADAARIKEFTGALRRFLKFEVPVDTAPETLGAAATLKMVIRYAPYLGALRKWGRISAADYAAGFNDPLLQQTFREMFTPETSVLFLLMTLVWMHQRDAGYPLGGSLNFARLIEKRYLELGGQIDYNSRVRRIDTAGDAAGGIVLADGTSHPADIVISAADGHDTVFNLLQGKYVDDYVRRIYETYEPFSSYLMVTHGVKRTFEGYPATLVLPLAEPLRVDPMTEINYIMVRIFNFDPSSAPAGSTVIATTLPSWDYQYWQQLRETDKPAYAAAKSRLSEVVCDILEARLGGIRAKLEMTDVSSPASVIRYTGNWRGSLEGWLLTPRVGLRGIRKTLPGLKGFYMAGQWVEPGGGVPAVMMSGRNVAQVICKADGVPFRTESYFKA